MAMSIEDKVSELEEKLDLLDDMVGDCIGYFDELLARLNVIASRVKSSKRTKRR
jgi:hypothetical protein